MTFKNQPEQFIEPEDRKMFTGKFIKTLLITSTLIGLPAIAQTNAGSVPEKAQLKVNSLSCLGCKSERRESTGRKLGLTDSQLEKIASLKDRARVDSAPQKAQLKELYNQLKLAITKPAVDQQEALQIQSKINDLRAQLSNKKLQERLNFMAILTPEQKETLRHKILVSESFRTNASNHNRHHFCYHRA